MTIQSYKEDSRPSQQWFWDDWFSAFDVRLCSLAARGLWIDVLGIMFKAEIRGTLTVNGRQVDNKTLANLTNASSVAEIKSLLKELERNNVFSRLDDGTIYCRRMFKESSRKEEISRIRAKAGKKGAKKRWQKNGKEISKNMAKMAASSPSSTPTAIPSSKDTIWQKLDEQFEKWWKRYPISKDVGKAKEKWLNLVVGQKVDPQEIEDALTGYINVLNNEQTDRQFIKHAKTFLYNGNKKKKIESTWRPFIKYADPKYKAKPPL